MANKRIRALTEVTSMGDTDVVAIDNTTLSEAKKITKANLLTETTAAIALKEDSANKTTDLSVSNDILFPTTEAVNEGLDLKLNKDFIPFTEETVVVGTDVVPINTGASVLKKMTLDTIKTWIIETATFTLSTVSQTIKGAINELFTVSKKYSGFVNRTDSVISIDGSGVFTIEPAVASFDVYTNGTGKHTISAAQTVTITEDQTITYVYFDNAGTLQKSTTSWDLVSGDNAPCAIIFKDATVYAVTDERHSYERNRAWHSWAHHNIGAMYKSGFTGTFTDTTLSVTQGVVADEDIEADSGGTKTTCSLWYRNATSGMRLIRNSTTPYKATAGVLQYDNGSGTLQPVTNNRYSTQWVYATSDAFEQIYVVIGQNNDILLADAENATAPIINLSTAEWKLIYRIIYRNAGGTPTYIESADFRTVQTGVPSTAVTTDHAALINRDAINSHPSTAISYDNATSGLTADDVKDAIDELADEKMDISTYDPTAVGADAFDSANHAYDNSTSGLVATDVQSAIDEVEGRVDDAETDIATLDANINTVGQRVNIAEKSIASILDSNPAGSAVLTSDTYAKITSLPANAADAPMKADLSGMTVTNLVYNGNFSNGTAGWSGVFGSSGVTPTTSGNVLNAPISASAITLFGGVRQNTSFSYVTGNVIYQRVTFRVTNAVCNSVRFSYGGTVSGGATTSVQTTPTENLWYTKSLRSTVNAGSGNYFLEILHYYATAEISKSKVIEIKDFIAINLTALGLDSITDTAVLDKMFPHYIDGTVHAGATRFTSKDEDGNIVSVSYTPPDLVLRRVPSARDTTERNTDGTQKKVQRVETGSIATTVYASLDKTTYTNVDVIKTTAFALAKAGTSAANGFTLYYNSAGALLSEVAAADIDLTASVGKYYYHTDKTVWILVAPDTYADIAAARTGLGTTTLYYELATPIETDLPAVPALISKSKGTVFAEPCVCDVDIYNTGITVSGKVFSEISKVSILNLVDGTEEDVTSDCTLNIGKDGFTCSSASADDYIWYELLVDTSTVANPEKNYKYFDSTVVEIDSVTSKVYRITHAIASGTVTHVATELV